MLWKPVDNSLHHAAKCVECGGEFRWESTSPDGHRVQWGYPLCPECVAKPEVRREYIGGR